MVGLVLGVALANGLTRYFGSTFFAITPGFGVDWQILVLSAVVGLLVPMLAAIPAIRRGVKMPLRGALESSGSAIDEQEAGTSILRHVHFLPRTAQIGLRSVWRAESAGHSRRWW